MKTGERIGKWVIEREIGSGSMGTVFSARDSRVDSQVRALKVVHPELARDEIFRKRFFQEFSVLESLRHPNILLVHDYMEELDTLILISEFLEGHSLRQELETTRKGLPWPRVLEWARQALRALDYAHGRKIIHRDIKPSNLFLCTNGTLKVIDFGLAKRLGDTTASITIAGMIVGTPAYLAPELSDAPPHSGSDLYALGITMHQLLAGKLPFDTSSSKGDQVLSMLKAHWTQSPPDLRNLVPDIPEFVAAAIEHALCKSPVDRFVAATEMVDALQGGERREVPPSDEARDHAQPDPDQPDLDGSNLNIPRYHHEKTGDVGNSAKKPEGETNRKKASTQAENLDNEIPSPNPTQKLLKSKQFFKKLKDFLLTDAKPSPGLSYERVPNNKNFFIEYWPVLYLPVAYMIYYIYFKLFVGIYTCEWTAYLSPLIPITGYMVLNILLYRNKAKALFKIIVITFLLILYWHFSHKAFEYDFNSFRDGYYIFTHNGDESFFLDTVSKGHLIALALLFVGAISVVRIFDIFLFPIIAISINYSYEIFEINNAYLLAFLATAIAILWFIITKKYFSWKRMKSTHG